MDCVNTSWQLVDLKKILSYFFCWTQIALLCSTHTERIQKLFHYLKMCKITVYIHAVYVIGTLLSYLTSEFTTGISHNDFANLLSTIHWPSISKRFGAYLTCHYQPGNCFTNKSIFNRLQCHSAN